ADRVRDRETRSTIVRGSLDRDGSARWPALPASRLATQHVVAYIEGPRRRPTPTRTAPRASSAAASLAHSRPRLLWSGRRVDKHVELLAHKQRDLVILDAIDHLQHAGINPLGGIAGERSFRQHEWLKPHELERRFQVGV